MKTARPGGARRASNRPIKGKGAGSFSLASCGALRLCAKTLFPAKLPFHRETQRPAKACPQLSTKTIGSRAHFEGVFRVSGLNSITIPRSGDVQQHVRVQKDAAHSSPRVSAITSAVVTPGRAAPRACFSQVSAGSGAARRARYSSSQMASSSTCGADKFSIALSISPIVLMPGSLAMGR